jgi:hypothetical protein
MKTLIRTAAFWLAVLAPAVAQSQIGSSAVGMWLYDAQGSVVGSVYAVDPDKQIATIMLGTYFQPGSRRVTIAVDRLYMSNGRVNIPPGYAEQE